MERELTAAEMTFISEARVGHLGTQRMGKWPHVVPVCHVLDLDRILIASAYDEKVVDIRENASVTYCVDVYSEDWDNGLAQVIVSGGSTRRSVPRRGATVARGERVVSEAT